MHYEDFRAFFEEDAVNYIRVMSATYVDVVNMPRNGDNWLHADMGTDHFTGDFEHLLRTKIIAGNHALSGGVAWGVSDVGGNPSGWGAGEELRWSWDPFGAGPQLRLQVVGMVISDSIALVANTDYWLRVTRVGLTVTVFVYSDAGRTVLVDSFSADELAGPPAYRYIHAAGSYHTTFPLRVISYEVRELDLREGLSGYPPNLRKYMSVNVRPPGQSNSDWDFVRGMVKP